MKLLILVTTVITAGPVAAEFTASQSAQQSGAPAANRLTSRITVTLPAPDAELVVNGEAVAGDGPSREFETRALETGRTHEFTFTVTWKPNGYTTMTRSKTVSVRAGEPLRVDLATEAPGDRARHRTGPGR